MLSVQVVVVGQLDGTVPGSVLINGKIPYSIINTNSCSNIPIRVSESTQYIVEVLNTGILDTKYYTNLPHSSIPLYIEVNITNCPIGFILKGSMCDCDSSHNITCNITTSTLNREYRSWIGYNDITNADYAKGVIFKYVCPLDYCDSEILVIPANDIGIESDMQCSAHRTGLLCGSCKTNFFLTLYIKQHCCFHSLNFVDILHLKESHAVFP